ncbi:MAG TPA: hypothetical protein VGG48_17945 [Rhizomicrobium sp.]|jgi:hypothetical protein
MVLRNIAFGLTALVCAGTALPDAALAHRNFQLNFQMYGAGVMPGVTRMSNYIIGCLTKGTWIEHPIPQLSVGPWLIETGRQTSANYVRAILMSEACTRGLFPRPARVRGVHVEDED